MRRKIIFNDIANINKIINLCEVCYIGMVDDENMPYVLPFNFGYENDIIYLHSAKTGKKINILKNNNNVCIVFSTGHEIRFQHPEVACSYMMKYRSVQAFGKVEFIDNYDEKVNILNIIMKKYTGKDFNYNKPAVNEVETFIVRVSSIMGKEFGY